jgi:geranylgeranyl diphosphate synthase, type I
MTASVMSASVSSAHTDAPAVVVARVNERLGEYLGRQCAVLRTLGADLEVVAAAAEDLVFGGGKRIRPQFAYWGWRAVRASGAEGENDALTAAASLELLHAAALVHDDLIDASATRRGRPAAHARFAAQALAEAAAPGAAAAFGSAAAILLGDQLLSWAWAMLAQAHVPDAASALFAVAAEEMMAGQYLDVLAQVRGVHSVETALRVARFKSGKYSVERPLQFGAAVGGAGAETIQQLGAFGLPLGEAFQLRDDVLGVFGDPAETGKPAGDDLRQGKRTVLVALAHQAGTDGARAELETGLGDAALDDTGLSRLRELIVESGALNEVEQMISARVDEAQRALDSAVIRPEAEAALRELVARATDREA